MSRIFLRCRVRRTKLCSIFAKCMENPFLFFIEDMQIFKTKIKLFSLMFADFKINSFSGRQNQPCEQIRILSLNIFLCFYMVRRISYETLESG
jgi:hypothetical protein